MLSDSFSISDKTLVVEGPTDLFAIKALNNFFKKLDKEYFDSDMITVFPGE